MKRCPPCRPPKRIVERAADENEIRAQRERLQYIGAAADASVDHHCDVAPDCLHDSRQHAKRRGRAVQLTPAVIRNDDSVDAMIPRDDCILGRHDALDNELSLPLVIRRGFSMAIELGKEVRADAIASIQKYFEKNMEEPIGNIAAGALLGFFLEEIGPNIYNKAVADAQEHLLQRVSELDFEVHEEEFQYWKKYEAKAKRQK